MAVTIGTICYLWRAVLTTFYKCCTYTRTSKHVTCNCNNHLNVTAKQLNSSPCHGITTRHPSVMPARIWHHNSLYNIIQLHVPLILFYLFVFLPYPLAFDGSSSRNVLLCWTLMLLQLLRCDGDLWFTFEVNLVFLLYISFRIHMRSCTCSSSAPVRPFLIMVFVPECWSYSELFC